jgi:hypothetical protein
MTRKAWFFRERMIVGTDSGSPLRFEVNECTDTGSMEESVLFNFIVSGVMHKKVALDHSAEAIPEFLAGKLTMVFSPFDLPLVFWKKTEQDALSVDKMSKNISLSHFGGLELSNDACETCK